MAALREPPAGIGHAEIPGTVEGRPEMSLRGAGRLSRLDDERPFRR
jgi:hypothetical protein